MAYISKVTTTDNNEYDIKSKVTAAIPYGECDSTSTATAFTATVDGITSLYDGVTVMLRNGVVTSASGFTININGLGAKPVYNNMATGNPVTPTNPTRDTTIFNINYTMLLVYDSNIVSGGGWICYRGYDGNTNTIGYQLRTNSGNLPSSDAGARYRLWLTSADGTKWVPINTSTSTDATTARTLNTRPIDPFGPIVYNSTNGSVTSGSRPPVATLWQQYTLTIGYSYVLSMTAWKPVYLQATPQTDGSAVMNALTQTLPSSKDGKIYIFLGLAYSATAMELRAEHPVYWHDGTGIRIWSGAEPSGGSSVDPATASPLMDGAAAVGSSAKYAREDHVHPTDTSRQAVLVSGTNIKTVNNNSLLGSGNITIDGGTALTTQEVETAVEDAFPWTVTVNFINSTNTEYFRRYRIYADEELVKTVTSFSDSETDVDKTVSELYISLGGLSGVDLVDPGQITCTGAIAYTSQDSGNPTDVYFSISGAGTITFNGTDWNK